METNEVSDTRSKKPAGRRKPAHGLGITFIAKDFDAPVPDIEAEFGGQLGSGTRSGSQGFGGSSLTQSLRDVLASVADSVEYDGIELTDVNQLGGFGNTPLKVACVRGDLEAVRVLLAAGAEVNAIVEDECTALHYAAGFGHVEVAQILLDHGARTDVRNRFGRTPVEDARLSGKTDVVTLLQSHKQSPAE
jgi:uncharacterized protein